MAKITLSQIRNPITWARSPHRSASAHYFYFCVHTFLDQKTEVNRATTDPLRIVSSSEVIKISKSQIWNPSTWAGSQHCGASAHYFYFWWRRFCDRKVGPTPPSLTKKGVTLFFLPYDVLRPNPGFLFLTVPPSAGQGEAATCHGPCGLHVLTPGFLCQVFV